MVQQLLERGVGGSVHDVHVSGIDPGRQPGQYRPPQPHDAFDGEINRGISYKFSNTEIVVHNKEGKEGINASHVYEHAFL